MKKVCFHHTKKCVLHVKIMKNVCLQGNLPPPYRKQMVASLIWEFLLHWNQLIFRGGGTFFSKYNILDASFIYRIIFSMNDCEENCLNC